MSYTTILPCEELREFVSHFRGGFMERANTGNQLHILCNRQQSDRDRICFQTTV